MALRPIYYDTETTGTKPDEDRIVEIAAYDPVRNATFVRFVNPGIPIPKEATAIHHISDEMVKDAPNFKIIAKEFMEFCSDEMVLIAHNNDSFDIHFLRNEFKRAGLSFPEWQFLDTLKWARRYRPDLPRHGLQFLRETYDIPENNAHRALDDVMVLYQLFSKMIDDLTMEQILELLKRPEREREISLMPFGKHQGLPLQEVPKNYIRWLADSGALAKEENKPLKLSLEKHGLLVATS
jgi:DNA polymerase-3 subunit epsilon